MQSHHLLFRYFLKLITGCTFQKNQEADVFLQYSIKKLNCKILGVCILNEQVQSSCLLLSVWMVLILIQNHLHVKDTA